jgi:hypothetical protein
MSMYPIATWTASADNQESSFLSIPQTFAHLQIRAFIKSPTITGARSTNMDWAYMRFNADATAANYASHSLEGDGVTASSAADATGTATAFKSGIMPSSTSAAGFFGSLVIDIYDYTNTNKNKTFRALSGADVNGVGGMVSLRGGLWISTAAITSIYLGGWSSGYKAGSRFDLYGISNSPTAGV